MIGRFHDLNQTDHIYFKQRTLVARHPRLKAEGVPYAEREERPGLTGVDAVMENQVSKTNLPARSTPETEAASH